MAIEIEKSRCSGCSYCVLGCLTKAIKLEIEAGRLEPSMQNFAPNVVNAYTCARTMYFQRRGWRRNRLS